jgi:hypothetical protein
MRNEHGIQNIPSDPRMEDEFLFVYIWKNRCVVDFDFPSRQRTCLSSSSRNISQREACQTVLDSGGGCDK